MRESPSTLCECGCGKRIPQFRYDRTDRYYRPTRPQRFFVGHNARKSAVIYCGGHRTRAYIHGDVAFCAHCGETVKVVG